MPDVAMVVVALKLSTAFALRIVTTQFIAEPIL
jgi:hypothetical protein